MRVVPQLVPELPDGQGGCSEAEELHWGLLTQMVCGRGAEYDHRLNGQ